MTLSHLNDIHAALTDAGWNIVAQHPGDDLKISGSWEVQRSTRYPPVFIDFYGFDDMVYRPVEEAYSCHIRVEPSLSLDFGKRDERWKTSLKHFVSVLAFDQGQFGLVFHLNGGGSAIASLWADGKHTSCFVSYLSSNPLGDLANQIVALMRSPDLTQLRTAWQDEPGEYRWVIERIANDVVVRVLFFRDTFSRAEDADGTVCFETSCSILRLATQVKDQMTWLLDLHGTKGYEERWRYPFPTKDYLALSEAIAEYEPIKPVRN